MQIFPITVEISTTKATSLIAQAQLKFSRADLSISGKIIPPTLEPTNAVPEAIPLLTSNQCATTDNAVVVKNAPLVPPRTP
jgi:hypothetical protein